MTKDWPIFAIWLLVAAILCFGLLAMELNGCATRTADSAAAGDDTGVARDDPDDDDGSSADDRSGENRRDDRSSDGEDRDDDRDSSARSRSVSVDSVIDAVADTRGLQPLNEIEVSYLDRDDLQDLLEEDLMDEVTPAEIDAEEEALKAIDLIPENLDLLAAMEELLTDQVVGFYDDETKELALISEEAELDVMNEVTLSHEVTHALQDQHFNLGAFYPLEGEATADANLARLALVEGDASLVMTEYIEEELSLGDLFSLGLTAGGESLSTGSMPAYLEEALAFPYLDGESFAAYLKQEGGWALVDGAYTYPPLSTEHILHPQKYLDGEQPVPVAIPDLLPVVGPAWESVYDESFGEFDVLQLLSDGIGYGDAADAAEGWGGGRYHYYERSDGAMMAVILLSWDDKGEADEFVDAAQEHLETTQCYDFEFADWQFPILESCVGDYWVMVQRGREVLVARVPDRTLANMLPAVVLGLSPPRPSVVDDLPPGSMLSRLRP